jgi:hypothetical protein
LISLCGKGDEWPSWSEKSLEKTKICEFKDLLLGKVCIPKPDDEFDDVLDIGKKMERAIELNEIAYTQLILSI